MDQIMAVFRKVKKTDYTVIDNNIFKNQKLTLKAKGMICTMLSLPDDWNFSEEGLTSLSNDGISSIRSTLKELMEYGYLKRERNRDAKGILRDYVYTIYEEPTLENQKQVEPTLEKPKLEKPTLENLKTYKVLNNKVLNNKETNNINIISKERFKKPTLEEVKEYCLERNNSVDAELFINYYESNGWKVGKNSMKDWKACVRTWERNKVNQHKESRYEREKRIMKEWLEKNEED
jgi:hypothetical protein